MIARSRLDMRRKSPEDRFPSILLPSLLFNAGGKQILKAREAGTPLVVFDIPLLYETKSEGLVRLRQSSLIPPPYHCNDLLEST